MKRIIVLLFAACTPFSGDSNTPTPDSGAPPNVVDSGTTGTTDAAVVFTCTTAHAFCEDFENGRGNWQPDDSGADPPAVEASTHGGHALFARFSGPGSKQATLIRRNVAVPAAFRAEFDARVTLDFGADITGSNNLKFFDLQLTGQSHPVLSAFVLHDKSVSGDRHLFQLYYYDPDTPSAPTGIGQVPEQQAASWHHFRIDMPASKIANMSVDGVSIGGTVALDVAPHDLVVRLGAERPNDEVPATTVEIDNVTVDPL
jgi:hypothetical protein